MTEEHTESKEESSSVFNHTVSDTIDAALEKLNINVADSQSNGNDPAPILPQNKMPSGFIVQASQVLPQQPLPLGMKFLPYVPHQPGFYPAQNVAGTPLPMNGTAPPVFIGNAGGTAPLPNFGVAAQSQLGTFPNSNFQQYGTNKAPFDKNMPSDPNVPWGYAIPGGPGDFNINNDTQFGVEHGSPSGMEANEQGSNNFNVNGDNDGEGKGSGTSTHPTQNKNSSRRQTFHGISSNDLVVAGLTKNGGDITGEETFGSFGGHSSMGAASNHGVSKHSHPAESNVKGRSRSMSSQRPESSSLFGSETEHKEGTPDGSQIEEGGEEEVVEEVGKNAASFSPHTYAAAYPYGGPPLQHKHPVPESQLLGPNFNYRMTSPLPPVFEFPSPLPSFAPVLGGTPPSMHIHSMMPPMPPSPLPLGPGVPERFSPGIINGQPAKNNPNDTGVDGHPPKGPMPMLQSFPILQHPQGNSPPPWIYGSPQYNGMVAPMVPPSMNVPRTPTSGLKNHQHSFNGNTKNERFHGRGKHGRPHGSNNRQMRYNDGSTSHNNGGGDGRSPASAELREMQRRAETKSQYADATLEQFVGSIYLLCRDQHGCRFLQRQLDLLGSKAADLIFNEVKVHTVDLMSDCFGNYLIQKLIEKAKPEQRLELARITAPKIVLVASNPHGTRALQKLIACAVTDEIKRVIIGSLSGSVVELSKDLNGNHVIQKCLQEFEATYCQFIFDAICDDCYAIATHRHGCCVLQRCLDQGSKDQFEKLCDELVKDTERLTLDPFGNYVIQYIINKEIQRGEFEYTQRIAKILKPKIIELSVHKFGSNVVEKLLRTPAVSETMIDGLVNGGSGADIELLLNDSFGNYVLQTALDVSHHKDTEKYGRLSGMVSPYLVGNIRNTPHGKRIASMLDSER